MKSTAELLAAVAEHFVELLRSQVGEEKMALIAASNREEKNPSVCHTHDFCDANEVMLVAFEKGFGRAHDLQSDTDTTLWGAAWDLSQALISLKYPATTN